MMNTVQFHLPPLLEHADGTPVTRASWPRRREELLTLFARHVYGVAPDIHLYGLRGRCVNHNTAACGGKNIREEYLLHFEADRPIPPMRLHVWRPRRKSPAPAVLMLDPFWGALHKNEPPEYLYSFFPADIITDNGIVAVQILCGDVCADDPRLCREGILGNRTGRPDEWGAIGAWAWCASRALEFLTQSGIADAARTAVAGCSRAGKAALWCGACDERFSAILANVSGLGGAAITRGKTGEHIADITQNYPYWFCPQYACYSSCEDALPVDQHMLLALAAPRALYIASASEDAWADPQAEYCALRMAAQAYSLLGKEVDLPARLSACGRPVHSGPVGYHLRQGAHDLTPQDWRCYLAFLRMIWA